MGRLAGAVSIKPVPAPVSDLQTRHAERQTYTHACMHPRALPQAHTDAVIQGHGEKERERVCPCSRYADADADALTTLYAHNHKLLYNLWIWQPSTSWCTHDDDLQAAVSFKHALRAHSRASRRCPAWLWFDDIWPASSSSHPTPTFVLLHRTLTPSLTRHTHTGGDPTKSAVFRSGPD